MVRIFSCSGRHAKISLKFTDKEPIFIDLSVNGSDFAKGSAAHHLLNH
ncbi:prevent-host-death protein [Ligilactobacillus ruminis]